METGAVMIAIKKSKGICDKAPIRSRPTVAIMSRHDQPERPVSCNRLTLTAMDGMITARSKTVARRGASANPLQPLRAHAYSSSHPRPALTRPQNSTACQNSEREARPEKVAYFTKKTFNRVFKAHLIVCLAPQRKAPTRDRPLQKGATFVMQLSRQSEQARGLVTAHVHP